MPIKPTILVLLAAIAVAFAGTRAQADESVEYKIKAGCLFKFLQFVEWPAEAFKDKEAPFILGVLGDNPFGDVLDQTVRDRNVDGRKVVVRRYKDAKAARESHVLFVGLKGEQLTNALIDLKGSAVLTVGECAVFIESGGIVRFVIREDKVGFEMNPETGKKAGLKIGAQLLRLAKIVNDKDK